jgi:hypothetical protein
LEECLPTGGQEKTIAATIATRSVFYLLSNHKLLYELKVGADRIIIMILRSAYFMA